MQLSVAIIISFRLRALELSPLFTERRRKEHFRNLSYTMMEFHKAQCYFISAIVVAVQVLVHQAYSNFRLQTGYGYDLPIPFFDVLLSVPLALNGIVPVTFTLVYIVRYHRLTWHILILSLVPVALSSTSLFTAYRWIVTADGDEFNVDGIVGDFGYDDSFAASRLVCGDRPGNLGNAIDPTDFRFVAIWLVYGYCITWLLWCFLRRILDEAVRGSLPAWTSKPLIRLSTTKVPINHQAKKLLQALSLALWGLCFGYHFYLYSLFIRKSLVPGNWTFGQIIAVTVWAPFVVEYLYTEHRKSFPISDCVH